MKTTFAKSIALIAASTALSATLIGCSSTPAGETEMKALSIGHGYVSSKQFTPIHLGDYIENDQFAFSIDSAGWTLDFLPISDLNHTDFYFKGTFTNIGLDRYRLSSSSEALIEFGNEYTLRTGINVVDGKSLERDYFVEPGETVTFFISTTVPRSITDQVDNAILTLSFFWAGYQNGIYATHASSSLGEYILRAEKDQFE